MAHAPLNPHAFDEYKLAHDSHQKAVDRLLDYQADTRQRVDTLVKAIFVLSGGALTISIGLFLKTGAPSLAPTLAGALRWSWWLQFYSLAASAALMFSMICQGYWHGWRWEAALSDKSKSISGHFVLNLIRYCNWVLGVSGFLAFLAGLALLAYVSVGAIP